jgi:alkyl sulfatase BDS1-like metallo-beta-lactamase superfamily hydrolase
MTKRRLRTARLAAAFALAGTLVPAPLCARAQEPIPPPQPDHPGHFDPKGKPPSKFTLEVLQRRQKALPLADQRDFEEQRRGFIAPMKDLRIMADAGHVAWDMERFQFLNRGKEFDSVDPSLQRQSVLNMNYGLYEVVPGIYQVRGFDLADISFVRGTSGWIVIDPLTSAETARAALKLFQEHAGEGRPVTAVIYSHSHGDHWGGVRGVIDEADARSAKVPVIAPRNFMQETISENVYAGNAMNRRLFYQYGLLLPASPYGYVGQGLGQAISAGAVGLIPPNRIVEQDIEEFEVDGVRMIFQNTPNTEAPANMNTYIPDLKALWMAENVTATMHNIYTLRGAPVRDPLRWSKYISQALYRFGLDAQVMFASHHWPRWGNERIQEVLRGQRDLYANMNNQVLHLANQSDPQRLRASPEPAPAMVQSRLPR